MAGQIRVLIIEDIEQVAKGLEEQLSHFLPHGHVVLHSRNVEGALRQISTHATEAFDLILCDYNLGENTNGQQLLEYLRFQRLIPRRTAFIMVTGESAYASVASAVELGPDAYLLKPYTPSVLAERVHEALVRREALKAVHQPLDRQEPDYLAALSACNAIILEAGRFALDALRLKAECLLRQEKWGEAANVYDKVLAWRALPWAEVGRARALRHAGYAQMALEKLKGTIKAHPQFVAAYDELASLAQERGEQELAQRILEKAHSVVPSNRRARQLGLLALDNGDLQCAVQHLRVVVDRDRYGLMRSTEDFFGLAHGLRQLGRHDEALQALDALNQHFPVTRPLTLRKQAAEAMVYQAAGHPDKALQMLKQAHADCPPHMEPRTQMELAEALHGCGDTEIAQTLFQHIAENWHESAEIQSHLRVVLRRAGMGGEAIAALEHTVQALISLNNRAASLIQGNHVQDAIDIMEEVAERLTHNTTVQSNYIQALLYWVENHAPPNLMQLREDTKPRRYLAIAREHLRKLAQVAPRHPRLSGFQSRFARLTGESQAGNDRPAFLEEVASMEIGG